MMIDILSYKSAINKCEEPAALVDRHTESQGNGIYATAIAPLELTRECNSAAAMPGVSEPLLAIVIQRQKELWLNEKTFQ